jgi:hypothetical protein
MGSVMYKRLLSHRKDDITTLQIHRAMLDKVYARAAFAASIVLRESILIHFY